MRIVVNIAGFYLGWFACILGAGYGQPLLGPAVVALIVALHVALHPARRREIGLVAVVMVTGVLIDTGMLLAGVLRFEGSGVVTPVFLLWIAALWINFGVTLTGCLSWLARWPWLAFVMGAVGGPATYYAGAKLGAIGLHEQVWISLVALGVEWGIMMPGLLWFAVQWHTVGGPEASPKEVRP